jgi:DNA-damage-inducible protein J
MEQTTLIKTKIKKSLNYEVESIFKKLGLSSSEAINLFYHQVKLRKGFPFKIAIPNKTTLKTFKDSDNGKNLIKCKNIKDMHSKLGI